MNKFTFLIFANLFLNAEEYLKEILRIETEVEKQEISDKVNNQTATLEDWLKMLITIRDYNANENDQICFNRVFLTNFDIEKALFYHNMINFIENDSSCDKFFFLIKESDDPKKIKFDKYFFFYDILNHITHCSKEDVEIDNNFNKFIEIMHSYNILSYIMGATFLDIQDIQDIQVDMRNQTEPKKTIFQKFQETNINQTFNEIVKKADENRKKQNKQYEIIIDEYGNMSNKFQNDLENRVNELFSDIFRSIKSFKEYLNKKFYCTNIKLKNAALHLYNIPNEILGKIVNEFSSDPDCLTPIQNTILEKCQNEISKIEITNNYEIIINKIAKIILEKTLDEKIITLSTKLKEDNSSTNMTNILKEHNRSNSNKNMTNILKANILKEHNRSNFNKNTTNSKNNNDVKYIIGGIVLITALAAIGYCIYQSNK